MSINIESGHVQHSRVSVYVWAIDKPHGHMTRIPAAEIISIDRIQPAFCLPWNCALKDIPERVEQLPYVDFDHAFKLPLRDDPLVTRECVIEIGRQRFWVRGIYSTSRSAPANGALLSACASAKLPAWKGEIAVVALSQSPKNPFLKTVNPITARRAAIKCVGLIYVFNL